MPPARQLIAAALMVVLALIGAGRGLSTAFASPAGGIELGGIVVAICHAGADTTDKSDGPDSDRHDCCDVCVLHAALDIPAPPVVTAVTVVAYVAERSFPPTWVPAVTSVRTPRLSQGPPLALS